MEKRQTIIQELLDLEDIEDCEEIYHRTFGYPPFNISTWDPSQEFMQQVLLNKVPLESDLEYINYRYSYDLPESQLEHTLLKLGGGSDQDVLITNSGTSSIDLVLSCLEQLSVKCLLIVSPTYFSVFYNGLQKGYQILEQHMVADSDGYHIPKMQILEHFDEMDAIWITNPVYNTGVIYTQEDIRFLTEYILPYKYLVADECFCLNGFELVRHLKHENFIGIYDPLKQVMINGIKFSAIIHHKRYCSLFRRWSDIINGSLSYSVMQALRFYLAKDFDQLSQHILSANKKTLDYVQRQVQQASGISLDSSVRGHLMMVYLPEHGFNLLQQKEAIQAFIFRTGASLIPGNRFHFPQEQGFSFRVNLARDCTEFRAALERILNDLSAII